MNQITNSPVKEAMRLRNERDARNKEFQIKQKLGTDIDQIRTKLHADTVLIRAKLSDDIVRVDEKKTTGSCCMVFLAPFLSFMGLVYCGLLKGLGTGLVFGVAIFLIFSIWVKFRNTKLDTVKRNLEADATAEIEHVEAEAEVKIRRLEANANGEIQNAYNEADNRTVQEINAYDSGVKQYCKRILQKADIISPMVDHMTNMFQRMVSHADAGSNKRFVEAFFKYKVLLTGITYIYQSGYTNPQDDYNFDKQRFRNLNNAEECEGLAQALAKLTIQKMMSFYPPNSLHITVSHVDAVVTMHYKAANKNFVAAQDIF